MIEFDGLTILDEDELADYKWLLQVVNPEEYHDFLVESVNSHDIGDEFDVPHNGDMEENYWDLAEYQGYVEIPYVNGSTTFRVKILKHMEETQICLH